MYGRLGIIISWVVEIMNQNAHFISSEMGRDDFKDECETQLILWQFHSIEMIR
jgi:hypothetical protein